MSRKPRAFEPKNLKLWTLPGNYFGAEWPDRYVFMGRHRDSDTLTISNFECGLKALGGESLTVLRIVESHWAVGWVEWIGIHKNDEAALKVADEIIKNLESYPVVDESDWSEREQEEADKVWKNCYSPSDRLSYVRQHRDQFEFRSWREIRNVVRGEYFNGYASELLC